MGTTLDRIRNINYTLWFLVLVLAFLPLPLALSIARAEWPFRTADAIIAGAMVDVVLTVFLIWVYMDVADFQETQATWMQRQGELIELQYKPRLRVRQRIADEGSARLRLANVGNGTAEKIFFRLDIRVKQNGRENGWSWIDEHDFGKNSDIKRISAGHHPLTRVVESDSKTERDLGGALPPGDVHLFETPFIISQDRSQTGGTPSQEYFHQILPLLFGDSDISLVNVVGTVLYTDIEDNVQAEIVWSRTVNMNEEDAPPTAKEIFNRPLSSKISKAEILKKMEEDDAPYPPQG